MSLDTAPVVAFTATTDAERARRFYEGVLDLRFHHEEPGAVVFSLGFAGTLRITVLDEHSPQPFSVLGWVVPDIEAEVDRLSEAGVAFERYEMLEQDDRGITTFPNGDRVAWFLDPDGNILSVTQPG